jgi:hypothetical protein
MRHREGEVRRSWQKTDLKQRTCELEAEEASDKPRRVVVTERGSLRNGMDSLVISWLGTGVARVLRVNSSEPMVGWKGAHPQSVSWMQPVIDKYTHTLCNLSCNYEIKLDIL